MDPYNVTALVDLSVMTSASNSTFAPTQTPHPDGLVSQSPTQLPSYALQSKGASMSPAWQTRNEPHRSEHRHGAPARSFADIMLDPWRYVTATKLRKSAACLTLALMLLAVLF